MLFLESFGIAPDIVASYEPITVLKMLHSKDLVMLVAHVANTKVYGGAVCCGGEHHLGHDPRDVQFLGRFFPCCLLPLVMTPAMSFRITPLLSWVSIGIIVGGYSFLSL